MHTPSCKGASLLQNTDYMLNIERLHSSIGALALLSIGVSTLAAQSGRANPRILDSLADCAGR